MEDARRRLRRADVLERLGGLDAARALVPEFLGVMDYLRGAVNRERGQLAQIAGLRPIAARQFVEDAVRVAEQAYRAATASVADMQEFQDVRETVGFGDDVGDDDEGNEGNDVGAAGGAGIASGAGGEGGAGGAP